MLAACTPPPEEITSSASGEIITDITAPAAGGSAPFDGEVNSTADLEDLVQTAWGDGALGLHRGHAPIENVLVAFLGISHDEMHVFMEQRDMNLADISRRFGLDPENLVETLSASFAPYLQQGVENGVIADQEVGNWAERVRTQFANRVYWG